MNVTPDSFSDGGKFFGHEQAIEHGLRLAGDGAAILDVGGESTRPYSTSVHEQEELRRVVHVVEQLAGQIEIPISIDTSKASVAEAAIDAGAEIINDVTGLEGDPRMLEVARISGVGVCAMHMQGTPQTMQNHPTYIDIVKDIYGYLSRRLDALAQSGIETNRICLDPGIGFGKTHQHNLTLLSAIGRFHTLGAPLLVGHSRKGFLAKFLPDKDADRTSANLGVTMALARSGVQVVRVHDVRETAEALSAFVAVGGVDDRALELKDEPQD